MAKRNFLIADHGLALVYFLPSEVVPTLLANSVEVIFFKDNERKAIEKRFSQSGLTFESLQLEQRERYFKSVDPFMQRYLQMLCRAGGSRGINVTAMDDNYHLPSIGFTSRGRFAMLFLRALKWLMRRLCLLQQLIDGAQGCYNPKIFKDLFENNQPDFSAAFFQHRAALILRRSDS
jgi:hypothetical protein